MPVQFANAPGLQPHRDSRNVLRRRELHNRRFFRRTRFSYPPARSLNVEFEICDWFMLPRIFSHLILLRLLRPQFRRSQYCRAQSCEGGLTQQVPPRQFTFLPAIRTHRRSLSWEYSRQKSHLALRILLLSDLACSAVSLLFPSNLP